MAAERGYGEIVEIIREQELKREKPGPEPAMEPAAAAVVRGDAAWIRARHAEGDLRDTGLAARMFRQEDAGMLPKGTVREGRTVAEEILDAAASAGPVDLLRMAPERRDLFGEMGP